MFYVKSFFVFFAISTSAFASTSGCMDLGGRFDVSDLTEKCRIVQNENTSQTRFELPWQLTNVAVQEMDIHATSCQHIDIIFKVLNQKNQMDRFVISEDVPSTKQWSGPRRRLAPQSSYRQGLFLDDTGLKVLLHESRHDALLMKTETNWTHHFSRAENQNLIMTGEWLQTSGYGSSTHRAGYLFECEFPRL